MKKQASSLRRTTSKFNQWRPWIQLLLGIGILVWLLAAVEFDGIEKAFATANWIWILTAFVLFICASALEGVRVWLVFKDQANGVILSIRIFMESLIFINILPGTLGGDGYLIMKFQGSGVSTAITRVFFIRAIGAFVLIILGVAAVPFWSGAVNLLNLIRYEDSKSLIFTIVVFLFSALLVGSFSSGIRSWVSSQYYGIIAALNLLSIRDHVSLLVLTVLMHFSRAAMFMCLLISVAFEASVEVGIILAAAALLSMLLPLTFAGLGVREGALVGVLLISGLEGPTATAIAILARVFLIAGALLGVASMGWQMVDERRKQLKH